MRARFTECWGIASRAHLALALTRATAGSGFAAQATPEQTRTLNPRRLSSCPGAIRVCGPLPAACGGARPASAKPAGPYSGGDESTASDA
jgi:hypothetical protein